MQLTFQLQKSQKPPLFNLTYIKFCIFRISGNTVCSFCDIMRYSTYVNHRKNVEEFIVFKKKGCGFHVVLRVCKDLCMNNICEGVFLN
jgi:hypothetical protein